MFLTSSTLPAVGDIYTRVGARPAEWWRISEEFSLGKQTYFILTRIDDRLRQTIVSLEELQNLETMKR
jgi:hypothetical protein